MVIISSFYNEEYLLPWWLHHHKQIFEQGILIDYFSTDRSVSLIKKICPHWKVIKTRNKNWDPRTNDQEFMDYEKRFNGYKMTLTTTEFLMGKMPRLDKELTAYKIPIVRMVDINPETQPTYGIPLVEQKRFGYLKQSFRKRFLHNYSDGQYFAGRDRTKLPTENCGLFVYKYSFSPWNEEMRKRRLQMSNHMSRFHLKVGWGKQHKFDKLGLEKEYQRLIKEEDIKKWTYQY